MNMLIATATLSEPILHSIIDKLFELVVLIIAGVIVFKLDHREMITKGLMASMDALKLREQEDHDEIIASSKSARKAKNKDKIVLDTKSGEVTDVDHPGDFA